MRTYLFNFSYSADALRAMIASPQDREAAVAASAESLGGKLLGFWYCFGAYDGHGLADMPDDTAAAAFAVMVSSTGALSKFETVPLMTMAEGIEVFKAAGAASYSPPS